MTILINHSGPPPEAGLWRAWHLPGLDILASPDELVAELIEQGYRLRAKHEDEMSKLNTKIRRAIPCICGMHHDQ